MGLLELLKAQGASDADLEAMKPLLSNDKYISVIETQLSAKEEAEKAKREAEEKATDFEKKFSESADFAKQMQDWYQNQALPAMKSLQDDAFKARETAARLQERIKAAKDYGLADIADPLEVTPPTPPAPEPLTKTDLPDLTKYVTNDQFLSTADMFGEAMAMSEDIIQEHRDLFGSRVNMSDLRKKAKEQKRSIKDIWETEYRVSDRRAELERKRMADEEQKRQEWISSIRKEEREKVISEMTMPTTRDPLPSKFPAFTTRTDAKSPWDNKEGVRASERVSKVLTSLAKGTA